MKRSRAHEDRRADIIRESAVLFSRIGYHGASMQMVADAVELGKPTLYHYFRKKSDILYAIHEEFIRDLRTCHAERLAQHASIDEQLLGIHSDILRQIAEHPGYVRAFFEHHGELDSDQKRQMRRQRREYLQMVCDVIATGIERGLFVSCEPRLIALGFLGMCNWAYKWYPQERSCSIEQTSRALCQVFLDGLKTR
jgi:AcrR family transcriptional regulator